MKHGTSKHIKVQRLMTALGIGRVQVVGMLNSLWELTADNAIAGDIGKLSDREISRHLDWSGRPEKLVSALYESGWIDHDTTHRLVIHDWSDHAEHWVKQRAARQGISLLRRGSHPYRRGAETTVERPLNDRQSSDCRADITPPTPDCRPETLPTHPSPTQPSPAQTHPAPAQNGTPATVRQRLRTLGIAKKSIDAMEGAGGWADLTLGTVDEINAGVCSDPSVKSRPAVLASRVFEHLGAEPPPRAVKGSVGAETRKALAAIQTRQRNEGLR